jgi:chromate reductase
MKIAILVGSLRKESLNLKTAKALISLSPKSLETQIIEIGLLPLYNEDLDHENVPAAWTEFRQKMKSCEGVLFVTPEYNRSVPGVLKNAIDVGSRPYGQSIWSGKPAAVISVSPGASGAFGANHHLRQSLVFLDMPTMQQPEAYIGNAGELFDESGKIINEKTKEFLQKFIDSYGEWAAKITRKG